MNKLINAVALSVILCPALGTPALGQTLDDRIAAIRKQQEERAARTRKTILQALLFTDLSVRFDQTPARDVFEYLRVALDVNLIVRYADDPAGYGIDPDLPITLETDGAPALDVLELVLEQVSVLDPCTWQLRKGFLEVGTKERLSVEAAHEVRWFPIDELTFQPTKFNDAFSLRLDQTQPMMPGLYGGGGGYYGGGPGWGGPYGGGFYGGGGVGGAMQFSTTGTGQRSKQTPDAAQSLMDLITDLVEPAAWTRNGGDIARMHYRDGYLIVVAPDFIQRQIFGYPKVPPPANKVVEKKKPAARPH